MSFIFPIISTVSIAITCGYILYKYFIEDNKSNDESNDESNNESNNKSNNESNNKSNDESNNESLMSFTYNPLERIVVDPIILYSYDDSYLYKNEYNKNEYNKIPSDDDFEIINNDDISNSD